MCVCVCMNPLFRLSKYFTVHTPLPKIFKLSGLEWLEYHENNNLYKTNQPDDSSVNAQVSNDTINENGVDDKDKKIVEKPNAKRKAKKQISGVKKKKKKTKKPKKICIDENVVKGLPLSGRVWKEPQNR